MIPQCPSVPTLPVFSNQWYYPFNQGTSAATTCPTSIAVNLGSMCAINPQEQLKNLCQISPYGKRVDPKVKLEEALQKILAFLDRPFGIIEVGGRKFQADFLPYERAYFIRVVPVENKQGKSIVFFKFNLLYDGDGDLIFSHSTPTVVKKALEPLFGAIPTLEDLGDLIAYIEGILDAAFEQVKPLGFYKIQADSFKGSFPDGPFIFLFPGQETHWDRIQAERATVRRLTHPNARFFRTNSRLEAMLPIGAQVVSLEPAFVLPKHFQGMDPQLFYPRMVQSEFASFAGVEVYGMAMDTGRSVTYEMPADYTYDGVRWRDMNTCGVNRTVNCNLGERRDGFLEVTAAWRKYLFGKALHRAARPYGYHGPCPVTVVLKDSSGALPPDSAILYELVDTHMRLSMLNGLEMERLQEWLNAVNAIRLEEDPGAKTHYLEWLVQRIGEQYAILRYFYVDHGKMDNGSSQIHLGNLTALGSIVDFETAEFTRDDDLLEYRYLMDGSHLSLSYLTAPNEAWGEHVNLFHYLCVAYNHGRLSAIACDAYERKTKELVAAKVDRELVIKEMERIYRALRAKGIKDLPDYLI